ncbi:hypothetical protein SC738_04260 [Legionella pneumophila serogroup 1]|nr:hypothetical protein [Legionella pneumophila]MDI9827028.1 hypothetical protein [Legionella pneumophila]MDW8982472.1 hypothetical protein [Legionella pneumophila]MDW8994533.1 hypothetical protein [Legionella pneumophila]HCC3231886.1 hypothetical protein [Legionella pneumophila subsp. pneumophila]
MSYRKRNGSDTWHWVPTCSNYPTQNFTSRAVKPSNGELCNQCQAKSKRN